MSELNYREMKTRQDAIKRMCELQATVSQAILQSHYPSDCFCGERERIDGYTSEFWRNSGTAIGWVEELAHKEIRRHRFKRKAVALIRDAVDAGLRFIERRVGLEETERW